VNKEEQREEELIESSGEDEGLFVEVSALGQLAGGAIVAIVVAVADTSPEDIAVAISRAVVLAPLRAVESTEFGWIWTLKATAVVCD
jgi:hypothetical protein